MKEILTELARYNLWANETLCNTILSLPEEEWNKPMISSFPGLFPTMLHMMSAESIWWQRLKLVENVQPPAENYDKSFQELINDLINLDKTWKEWVENASPHALSHVFYYRNSKRQEFRQPVYQVLIHLFNHNTYHRGQLVNLIRQAGYTTIPQTDFIVWSRKKAKK